MLSNRVPFIYRVVALICAVCCITACGKKEEATPDAAPTLSPEARSAMQTQQRAEASDRAAHAPPPGH